MSLPCHRSTWCMLLLLLLGSPVRSQPPADRHGDALPPEAALRMGTTRLRHTSAITSIAFSPDGRTVAAADYEGKVCLWDTSTEVKRLELPRQTGSLVAFSPDGKVLATGGYEGIILRNPCTGKKIRPVNWTGRFPVRSFAFSPDSKTLAVVGSKEVCLCDVASGQETRQLKGHTFSVWTVAFSPDGKLIATGDSQDRAPGNFQIQGDTTIILWDAATGQEVRRIKEAHHGWTYSLTFSANSQMVAAASPYKVRIWDATNGKQVRELDQGRNAVIFSPQAERLVTAGVLAVHHPATGQQTARMEGATEVQCVAFSPDGKMVASGGRDGLVRFWNAETGKEISRQTGHEQGVRSVAFSPDGTVVASASAGDGTVRVWGTASGAQLRKIRIGCTTPNYWCKDRDGANLTFSPDGKTVITSSCDGVVHLWELSTGRSRDFPVGERWVTAIALAADGKTLAAAYSESSVRAVVSFYDVATSRELQKVRPFGDKAVSRSQIVSMAFSPDGKTLALAGTGEERRGERGQPAGDTVLLWDVPTGQKVRSFRPAAYLPMSLLFSPDGQHLVTPPAGTGPLQIWEVATGLEVRKLPLEGDDRSRTEPVPIALSVDGKVLASTNKDHQIILWEMATGREVRRLRGHAKAVTALAFAPDGKSLLSGSEDTTVLLWPVDAREKNVPEQPKKPDPAEMEQAWNDLGADTATAHRAIVRLAAAPETAVALLGQRLKPASARDLARLPLLIAELAGAEAKVRTAAAAELREYGSRAEPALYEALRSRPALEVRRELELILAAVNEHPIPPEELRRRRAVQVLERIGTPPAELLLKQLTEGAPSAEPTRDARLALERLEARRQRKSVLVLTDQEVAAVRQHLVGSREPRVLPGHAGRIAALAFSADGKLLASAGMDGDIILRNVAEDRQLRRLAGHPGGVHGLAFSAGGKALASAGADRRVRVWNPADGRELLELQGHTDQAACVAFSPDGKTLASGGYDAAIRLWDAANGQLLHQVKPQARKVTSLAFSLDGKTLASGGLVPEQNPFGGGISYSQPALIQLWNVENGKETATLPIRGSDVVFACDGRTLVSSGLFYLIERDHNGWSFITVGDTSCFPATRIHWWDLARKREVRHLQGRGGAVAFAPDGKTLACVSGSHSHHDSFMWGTNTFGSGYERGHAIRLLESTTGKEVLKGPPLHGSAVAWAPDGRTLAWGDDKGSVFLWDLMPVGPLAPYPAGPTPADLERLWQQLAGDDPAAAYQVVWTLAALGKATAAVVQDRLRPAVVDEKRLTRLIAELGSDEFAVREAASRELEKLGAAAEEALLQAREKNLSPEARRRVEALLEDLSRSEFPAEELRGLRAVQVLEKIGSAEARRVLNALAGGSAEARLTFEARLALQRLRER